MLPFSGWDSVLFTQVPNVTSHNSAFPDSALSTLLESTVLQISIRGGMLASASARREASDVSNYTVHVLLPTVEFKPNTPKTEAVTLGIKDVSCHNGVSAEYSSGQRPALGPGAWSPSWYDSCNSPTYKWAPNSPTTLGVWDLFIGKQQALNRSAICRDKFRRR